MRISPNKLNKKINVLRFRLDIPEEIREEFQNYNKILVGCTYPTVAWGSNKIIPGEIGLYLVPKDNRRNFVPYKRLSPLCLKSPAYSVKITEYVKEKILPNLVSILSG
ncbi:MAG: hypothetical protein AABW81_04280 [Nanoarchaeota archaeon]